MGDALQGTFGERVKERRTALNMTLRELARRIGRAPSYLNDIEYDRRVPSEPVVREICEVLGLEADVMLALAGRVTQGAEQYMKARPTAGILFRRLSEAKLGDAELRQLIQQVDRLEKKRDHEEEGG